MEQLKVYVWKIVPGLLFAAAILAIPVGYHVWEDHLFVDSIRNQLLQQQRQQQAQQQAKPAPAQPAPPPAEAK